MIEVGAAREVHLGEQVSQRVDVGQGINQLGLLPVRQEALVDAHVFFYEFIRLLQNVLLELQAADVAAKLIELFLQLCSFDIWRGGVFLTLHGCGCRGTEQLVLPVVQRRPAHANLIGNRLRTSLSHAQRDDSGMFHFGPRCRTNLGSANDARRFRVQLTNPGRKRSSRGIAQCLDSRCERAPMLQVVLDCTRLLRLRILRRSLIPRGQVMTLHVLLMPALERVLRRVSQLTDRGPDPQAQLDVETDRSKSILVRKHELPP